MRIVEIIMEDTLQDIERVFFGFDYLYPKRSWASIRKRKPYRHKLVIAKALTKALGVKEGYNVFRRATTYSTNNYARMNNSLRQGKTPKATGALDTYIEHAPKSKQNLGFRGIGHDLLSKLKVGKTFSDPAFMSVTVDKAVAKHFPTSRKKGGVLIISGIQNKAAIMPTSYEKEYLLPRNTTLRIDRIDDKEIYASII